MAGRPVTRGPAGPRPRGPMERPASRPGVPKGPAPNPGCRAKVPLELQTCPAGAQDPRSASAVSLGSYCPQSTYLTFLRDYFKPERLTKLENRVKEKTVEALKKLDELVCEAQSRRDRLLQDSRQLQQERSQVEAGSSSFLKYLSKKNDQCREQHQELWRQYFQEREEIEGRRQALVNTYAQRTADLRAQLLQGRKTQLILKQQLQAMRHISLVRDWQDRKVQMLLQEKDKVKAEAAAKDWEAHLKFLQQKARPDRHMSELDRLQRGEPKSKVQALTMTAERVHSDFCHWVSRENRELREELRRLIEEYHKLEAIKLQLKKQIRQLKEEQWHLEASVKGRQWLLEECGAHGTYNQCPEEQRPHKAH